MPFEDREHAGRLLAARLGHLRGEHPVVLGLTRGGMPVAFEVARELGAPLDLVVVRRLRARAAPERSIGAIAEGGSTYLNPTFIADARLRHEDAVALAEEAIAELARQVRLYRGDAPAPDLHGRLVVIVDDFVATGATVRAAARAARQRGAARVLLAAPVLAAAVAPELRGDLDAIVALEPAPPGRPPGDAYEELDEVTAETALWYLRRAQLERLASERAPAALH